MKLTINEDSKERILLEIRDGNDDLMWSIAAHSDGLPGDPVLLVWNDLTDDNPILVDHKEVP